MIDRFSGDPKLILTQAGADLQYTDGQPLMDQGVENQAMISLFTRRGWFGNAYLPSEQQVGSDFVAETEKPITLRSLTDVANAAERALKSDLFANVKATVSNPHSTELVVSIAAGIPGKIVTELRRSLGTWSQR